MSFSTRTPTPSSSSSSHTLPWRFQVSTPRNQIQSVESTPLRRLNRLPTRFFGFHLGFISPKVFKSCFCPIYQLLE
jgi:hypothetical protein